MSWNLFAQSCYLELKEIKTKTEFDALLKSLATEIWKECIYDDCVPDHFGCDHIPSDEEQGVALIANGLKNYIIQFDCSDEGASFIVYSEYDVQECGDGDLADRISTFFLLNSGLQYCLTQSAAFDNSGGYAHQWITVRDGDQVKSMSTHKFMETLFAKSGDMLRLI